MTLSTETATRRRHFFLHTLHKISMADTSLIIVRGARNADEYDPTFSCMSHAKDGKQYAAIELENGKVVERKLFRGSQRRELERIARSDKYTAVYADMRRDGHLLPFSYPNTAIETDLNTFRRAKSDTEMKTLSEMSQILQKSCKEWHSEDQYRGAVNEADYNWAMDENTNEHFTVKRFGITDSYGRTLELSTIDPHTEDWSERTQRVFKGCEAVAREMKEGALGEHVDSVFRACLDPEKDILFGRVFHHSGYEPWEHSLNTDVIERYDVLTMCPTVGDMAGNWVPFMQSVHIIDDTPRTFRSAIVREDGEEEDGEEEEDGKEEEDMPLSGKTLSSEIVEFLGKLGVTDKHVIDKIPDKPKIEEDLHECHNDIQILKMMSLADINEMKKITAIKLFETNYKHYKVGDIIYPYNKKNSGLYIGDKRAGETVHFTNVDRTKINDIIIKAFSLFDGKKLVGDRDIHILKTASPDQRYLQSVFRILYFLYDEQPRVVQICYSKLDSMMSDIRDNLEEEYGI